LHYRYISCLLKLSCSVFGVIHLPCSCLLHCSFISTYCTKLVFALLDLLSYSLGVAIRLKSKDKTCSCILGRIFYFLQKHYLNESYIFLWDQHHTSFWNCKVIGINVTSILPVCVSAVSFSTDYKKNWKNGIEVICSGIMFVPRFMKIGCLVWMIL
jgi:hypothetical protein